MVDKKQFTTRFLLTEMLLLAIGLGMTRWILRDGSYESRVTVADFPLPTLSIAAIVAAGCFGGAIGGLFGKMRDGALCAIVFAFVVMTGLTFRSL
jgi:hypothetical protein